MSLTVDIVNAADELRKLRRVEELSRELVARVLEVYNQEYVNWEYVRRVAEKEPESLLGITVQLDEVLNPPVEPLPPQCPDHLR